MLLRTRGGWEREVPQHKGEPERNVETSPHLLANTVARANYKRYNMHQGRCREILPPQAPRASAARAPRPHGAAMTPPAPPTSPAPSQLGVPVAIATSGLEAGALSNAPSGRIRALIGGCRGAVTRGGLFRRYRLGFPFAMGGPASSLAAAVAPATGGRGAA